MGNQPLNPATGTPNAQNGRHADRQPTSSATQPAKARRRTLNDTTPRAAHHDHSPATRPTYFQSPRWLEGFSGSIRDLIVDRKEWGHDGRGDSEASESVA